MQLVKRISHTRPTNSQHSQAIEMEFQPLSDSDTDSLDDFQANLQVALSGLEELRKFQTRGGAAAGTSRRAARKKRGPKMLKVTNKWYYLPAGSPVPNFKSGGTLLAAHRREGYGFPSSHWGENGVGLPLAMSLDMTDEEFTTRLQELFPNLRGDFQCFKLNRQKELVPLSPNNPSALCKGKSKDRCRGIVFVKDKIPAQSASTSEQARTTGGPSSSTTPASTSEQARTTGGPSSSTTPANSCDSFEEAGTPSVMFRRQLIRQQDQEFREVLRADREREEIEEASADRRRRRQQALERRRSGVSEEPAEGSLLRIRFPDGTSTTRRFDLRQSIQVVFNVIALHPDATGNITIHANDQNHRSDQTGSCEEHGLRDRMTVFVSWNDEQEAETNMRLSGDLSDHSTSSIELLPDAHQDVVEVNSDWKVDLMLIQTGVTREGAPTANCLNVTRDRVMESARRGFNRKNFAPMKTINIVFVDSEEVGEGAVDNGGPTREFFRLLLQEATQSPVFKGPLDARQLEMSTQALSRGMYRDVGRFIALSIVHGGPGPKCLSQALYRKLTGQAPQCSITDICDETVEIQLRQISEAQSVEGVSEKIIQSQELLSVLGCVRHVRTLEERDDLIKSAVDYYVFGRLQLALEQFMEGLSTAGILEFMRNHHKEVQPLFVNDGVELSSTTMQALFMPVLSTAGSNKRTFENRILAYWRDWLIDIEEGESEITLGQLMSFVTGGDDLPPLGFTTSPSLEFLHEGGVFPTANTCALIIRLPILANFEEWTKKMEDGIIQSPSFGIA